VVLVVVVVLGHFSKLKKLLLLLQISRITIFWGQKKSEKSRQGKDKVKMKIAFLVEQIVFHITTTTTKTAICKPYRRVREREKVMEKLLFLIIAFAN